MRRPCREALSCDSTEGRPAQWGINAMRPTLLAANMHEEGEVDKNKAAPGPPEPVASCWATSRGSSTTAAQLTWRGYFFFSGGGVATTLFHIVGNTGLAQRAPIGRVALGAFF